ncbi:MAG: hypothetical protein RIK87_28685 [Fuerstiella sp.]
MSRPPYKQSPWVSNPTGLDTERTTGLLPCRLVVVDQVGQDDHEVSEGPVTAAVRILLTGSNSIR